MSEGAGRVSASDRNVNRLLVGLLSAGFAALLISAVAAVWFQLRSQDYGRLVDHTRQVETLISDFSTYFERVETARRGYLVNGDESFRAIFEDNVRRLPQLMQGIATITADNPRQQARAAEAQRLLAEQQRFQRRTMEMVAAGVRAEAVANFRADASVPITRRIRAVIEEMRDDERRLLVVRDEDQRTSLSTFYGILVAAGLLLLLVTAATMIVLVRYTRSLDASQAELRRLNENLEGAVQERTTDLMRANEEIQRFAYIVSHDLRSPLVNVMGFTAELDAARKTVSDLLDGVARAHPELVSRDAELAVRQDLPEAIGFIRTSTQKMDRLINAILRLSREGRRTLAPEALDMDQTLQSIVDSLHQRIGDAGAEVRIELPLPPIVNDRVAIEQIFSNLIENAVKYLQSGRPGLIVVRGGRDRDRAIFEVEDNGRGIDPRDHQRIFDLFRRSGAQDQPGEGIGLAHVRALAYRLGGVIDVRSELDRGATFRLSLPLRYEPAEGN